jgi:hypothetical protein
MYFIFLRLVHLQCKKINNKKKMKKISIISLIFGLMIVFAQCKKATTPVAVEVVDPTVASYLNMQTHIFKHSCNTSGCHNTSAVNNVQHGLVLEGADVYERLININPKNIDAKNAKLKLVMPGKSDSSFLLTKCNWVNTSLRFGNQMPLGADPISANEIEYIKQWINAGAPKTGVVANVTLIKAH